MMFDHDVGGDFLVLKGATRESVGVTGAKRTRPSNVTTIAEAGVAGFNADSLW